MLIFSLPFILGCSNSPHNGLLKQFLPTKKITESNYMKTPCIWDGATVKKTPKVPNVPNMGHAGPN